MITLPYGFKKPENLDRGDVFFDALSDNVTRVDGHSHNGVNSVLLSSDSLAKYTVLFTASGWTSVGDGYFKKQGTIPGAFKYGTTNAAVYMDGGAKDNERLYPRMVRLSDTTFEIYMMVSNQALRVSFA